MPPKKNTQSHRSLSIRNADHARMRTISETYTMLSLADLQHVLLNGWDSLTSRQRDEIVMKSTKSMPEPAHT